jgi:hypothetical protein
MRPILRTGQTLKKIAAGRHNDFGLSLTTLNKGTFINLLEVIVHLTGQNVSDVFEMKEMFSAVNRLLVVLQRDLSFVRKCFGFYVRTVTHFRRLFMRSGYRMFLKTMFDFIVSIPEDSQIFKCMFNSVVYCWRRFYALHEESFIFQLHSCIVPSILERASAFKLLVIRFHLSSIKFNFLRVYFKVLGIGKPKIRYQSQLFALLRNE